ncbi:MAG TPA: hypothetical protein VJ872_00290, partial [Nocardioides sp.]|nr:hypothetical protein [Nocardioides sp.]
MHTMSPPQLAGGVVVGGAPVGVAGVVGAVLGEVGVVVAEVGAELCVVAEVGADVGAELVRTTGAADVGTTTGRAAECDGRGRGAVLWVAAAPVVAGTETGAFAAAGVLLPFRCATSAQEPPATPATTAATATATATGALAE